MTFALRASHAQTLRLILRLTEEEGYPPTVREIAGHMKRAYSGVDTKINALRRDGCLERGEPRKARGLTLTSLGIEFLGGSVSTASAKGGDGMLASPARCTMCRTAHFSGACPYCGP